jgi:molybdopterin molybdotransferase
MSERSDVESDVDRTVEIGSVGAVHLAPAPVAVGAQPEVGLIQIAKQHELTNLPQWREPDDVLHVFSTHMAAGGPRFVVPGERERLDVLTVPGGPNPRVSVGRKWPVRTVGRFGVGFEVRRGRRHTNSLPGTVSAVTPLEDAQSFVLGQCPPLAPMKVAFDDAIGMVLAVDVVAAELVPPFDNTAVDGYAVVASSVAAAGERPVELEVVAEVAAGTTTDHVVVGGEAVRIMTGAPIPAGADAVVMVEDTDRVPSASGGDRVRIKAAVRAGSAVRRAGSDVQPGDLLFPCGTEVTPVVAGVLASVNARSVVVYPRARVAVLSTGDELVEDGGPLAPGQIRESNRPMLAGLLREAGCIVVDHGLVADDEAALEAALRSAAAECDAIVTSGGVSMGDYDVVKAVLGRIADMHWMQIAIKPAKPFAFGTIDGTPIFGLPGNPVSSLVSFEMLARPALRRMMGHSRLARPSVVAITDDDIVRSIDGKLHLVRVAARFDDDGRCHVRAARAQGSHQLVATALSNAIAIVPDGEGVPAGAEVAVVMLAG